MHCFIVNMAVGDIFVALGAIPFDIDYMLVPRLVTSAFIHFFFQKKYVNVSLTLF